MACGAGAHAATTTITSVRLKSAREILDMLFSLSFLYIMANTSHPVECRTKGGYPGTLAVITPSSERKSQWLPRDLRCQASS